MNQLNHSGRPAVPQRAAWQAPQLTVLGDVTTLTETGSAASNESPLNWCLDSVNMVGSACMG